MIDDITNKRREKLKDTIRKAAKELLGFGNIPIAGFSFPLDELQHNMDNRATGYRGRGRCGVDEGTSLMLHNRRIDCLPY